MIEEITQTTEFESVISNNPLVFVDFYTTWCEPCKLLDQILDRIEFKVPKGMKIVKMDSEKFPELSSNFKIRSAPVLFVFKNGKIVWRMNGFKMDDELLDELEGVSRETGSKNT